MRGVCGRTLKLPFVREGCVMKEPMITGRQPDSGNPTVRDERGACENVNYGEGYTGTYSGNAETAKPLAYGCARRISTRRSGQQGRNPAGESPAVSVARVGHVAMPHLGAGNQPSYAWCKRPGRPEDSEPQRWVQPGGLASVGA